MGVNILSSDIESLWELSPSKPPTRFWKCDRRYAICLSWSCVLKEDFTSWERLSEGKYIKKYVSAWKYVTHAASCPLKMTRDNNMMWFSGGFAPWIKAPHCDRVIIRYSDPLVRQRGRSWTSSVTAAGDPDKSSGNMSLPSSIDHSLKPSPESVVPYTTYSLIFTHTACIV